MTRPFGLLPGADDSAEQLPPEFIIALDALKEPPKSFFDYIEELGPEEAATYLRLREQNLTMYMIALRGGALTEDDIDGWRDIDCKMVWKDYGIADLDVSSQMRSLFIGMLVQRTQGQIDALRDIAEGQLDEFETGLQGFKQGVNKVWDHLQALDVSKKSEIDHMIERRMKAVAYFCALSEGHMNVFYPDSITSFTMTPELQAFFKKHRLSRKSIDDPMMQQFIGVLHFIAEFELHALQNFAQTLQDDSPRNEHSNVHGSRSRFGRGVHAVFEGSISGSIISDVINDGPPLTEELRIRMMEDEHDLSMLERLAALRDRKRGVHTQETGLSTNLRAGQSSTAEELEPGSKVNLSAGSNLVVMDDATNADFSLSAGSTLTINGDVINSTFHLSAGSTLNVQGDAMNSTVYLSNGANFNLSGDNLNTRIVR